MQEYKLRIFLIIALLVFGISFQFTEKNLIGRAVGEGECIDLDSPFTITSDTCPDNYCKLCRKVYQSAIPDFMIHVDASDITLDCDGAVLNTLFESNGHHTFGHGIMSMYNRVKIKNCDMKFFLYGVYSKRDMQVENTRAVGGNTAIFSEDSRLDLTNNLVCGNIYPPSTSTDILLNQNSVMFGSGNILDGCVIYDPHPNYRECTSEDLLDLEYSSCYPTQGSCGDGILNGYEECDGEDWGGIVDCDGIPGYSGGTLKCVSTQGLITGREEYGPGKCMFDVSDCILTNELINYCGDSTLETGEECDDGNRMNNDGCTSMCKLEQTPPSDDGQDGGSDDEQDDEPGDDPQDDGSGDGQDDQPAPTDSDEESDSDNENYEDCTNHFDDDGDGWSDCYDIYCVDHPACVYAPPEQDDEEQETDAEQEKDTNIGQENEDPVDDGGQETDDEPELDSSSGNDPGEPDPDESSNTDSAGYDVDSGVNNVGLLNKEEPGQDVPQDKFKEDPGNVEMQVSSSFPWSTILILFIGLVLIGVIGSMYVHRETVHQNSMSNPLNPEIRGVIRQSMNRGVNPEKIHKVLIRNGYSKKDADKEVKLHDLVRKNF
ncbi:MAG: hypothetical protein KKG59_01455 [Nanoarchaeota archaeon]|nr:hypothetical protein [Nanoarchaeota archaeon]